MRPADVPSATIPPVSRRALMHQLCLIRTSLREHGIRDAADYAEALVAQAVEGDRVVSRVTKGHDVLSPRYGRIEVKCRQLPSDGRIEERVELGAAKEAGFDYLAVVIFLPDFSVKGAVLVPYASVWSIAAAQHYNRVSYPQACALAGAMDITPSVRAAAGE